MRAAAVALRDYKVATGAYGGRLARSALVLGGEGVGEVRRVRRRRHRMARRRARQPAVRAGLDRGACASRGRSRPDARAGRGSRHLRRITCWSSAGSLVEVPPHLSDAEAATLPFAGLDGVVRGARAGRHRAERRRWWCRAPSGIPLFALQFAKLARCAGDRHLEERREARAREARLGADHTINYQTVPEWSRAVLDTHRRPRRRPRARIPAAR